MEIPSNSDFQRPKKVKVSDVSDFQRPKKVKVSDVIDFQLGSSALQASFAKALQEPDTDSVVIVNVHQPIQSMPVELSNTKVMKNVEKKRSSLNQQIRDIIYKSIKSSKRSKNSNNLEIDKNKGDGEEGMFIVDHNLTSNKSLADLDKKAREDGSRKVRKFDKNIQTSSLDTSHIKESEQTGKKHKAVAHKEFQEITQPSETLAKEKSYFSTDDKEEEIENKLLREEIKEPDNTRAHSQPELEARQTSKEQTPIKNENVTPPLPSAIAISPSSSISPRCIMSLPPDFFELFEKLVGIMIIEQNTSGITNVTVTINRPGSALDKSKVLLQFFDTNPRSCNVELRGTPEAVHYFHKHHGEFVNALQQSKLSLEINVRRPSLLQKKKIVKRKN